MSGLALKASIAVLLVAVAGCSGGDLSAEDGATVEVDIFSGRTNPGATMDAQSANELKRFIQDLEPKATAVEEPQWPLGFRGFVVTFDDPTSKWSRVRVLSDRIYIEENAAFLEVEDGTGDAYGITLKAIQDELDPDVLATVDESN